MKNLGQMMKQVQEMQDKMQLMQDKMNDISIDGVSGAGMIIATLNGKGMVQKIKIDPTIIDPQEVEMLEDLIVAAVNDARSKVDIKVSEKMQEVSGGLSLPPGFKLPF
jgi:DNA-binding YbaB/EbfC family protein